MQEIIDWFIANRNMVWIGLGIIIYIFITYHQVRIIRRHLKNKKKLKKEDRDLLC